MIRRFSKNEVDEETYNKEYTELQEQVNTKTQELLDNNEAEEKANAEKYKEEVNKMTDEKKADEPKKIGRKPSETSTATLILKALSAKDVKDADAAVAHVCENKSDLDQAKVKTQVKTIIREAKAGKGRWKNYNWDEEQFLLTEK